MLLLEGSSTRPGLARRILARRGLDRGDVGLWDPAARQETIRHWNRQGRQVSPVLASAMAAAAAVWAIGDGAAMADQVCAIRDGADDVANAALSELYRVAELENGLSGLSV